MTKESSDRLQINVRLSPEHSSKLLNLTKHSTAGSVVIIGSDFTVPVGQVEVAPTTLAGALLGYAIDHFDELYGQTPATTEEPEPVIDDDAWGTPGSLPLGANPMEQFDINYGDKNYIL
jgi:hypothetical protein